MPQGLEGHGSLSEGSGPHCSTPQLTHCLLQAPQLLPHMQHLVFHFPFHLSEFPPAFSASHSILPTAAPSKMELTSRMAGHAGLTRVRNDGLTPALLSECYLQSCEMVPTFRMEPFSLLCVGRLCSEAATSRRSIVLKR